MKKILFLILAFGSTGLWAHPGHELLGLGAGFWHPVAGMDHLLVALGVGVWAVANQSIEKRYSLLGIFLVGIVLGLLLGVFGISLPYEESGIFLSVLFFGLALTFSTQLTHVPALVLVSVFGLLHGNVHALEREPSLSLLAYFCGLIASTSLLLLMGLLVTQFLETWATVALRKWTIRVFGLSCLLFCFF